MIRYIALLRGINVSGQKIITMETLRGIFENMGYGNVATYIQSGNVIFDAKEKNRKSLTAKIEQGLAKALGYDVAVIIRTKEEMAEIAALQHFASVNKDKAKPYVVFTAEMPETMPEIPFFSPKKDVEVIAVHNGAFFCLSHPAGGGRWGFPNAFIEKHFKVAATTRNWNTVHKVLKY